MGGRKEGREGQKGRSEKWGGGGGGGGGGREEGCAKKWVRECVRIS